MKSGLAYITFSDGKIHFLMLQSSSGTRVHFSAPTSSVPAAVETIIRHAASNNLMLDRVVVALDGRECIIKNYRFPLHNRRQINQAVGFALEEDLPFQPDDMICDYFWGDHQDGESSICAVALNKTTVASLLECCAEEGIIVEALDVDVAAYARVCIPLVSNQEQALGLDIGQTRTLLCHLVRGKVHRLAVIPWGTDSLRKAIVDDCGLTHDEVERLWAFSSIDLENVNHETSIPGAQVEAFLNKLLRETSRQLNGISLPGQIILSGDIVRMQGFCKLLTHVSQARLYIWDELYFQPGEEVEDGLRVCDLAAAFGLAEAKGPGFQLRKDEFASPRRAGTWDRKPQFWAGLLILIMLAWGAHSYASHVAQTRELAALQQATVEAYKAVLPDVSSSLAPAQYQSILSSRMALHEDETVNGATNSRLTVIELLRRLSESIAPEIEVELHDLSLSDDRISFHGESRSLGDVESLRRAMLDTHAFSQVAIRSAVSDKKNQRVNFEIEVLR